MTHDHNHSHAHTHDHGHSHDHGHVNGHDHSHSHEMTFEQKLQTLLGHWIDHNDSHKDTFLTWAKRADDEDITQIAANLKKAGQLSEQVTIELKDALKKLNQL